METKAHENKEFLHNIEGIAIGCTFATEGPHRGLTRFWNKICAWLLLALIILGD